MIVIHEIPPKATFEKIAVTIKSSAISIETVIAMNQTFSFKRLLCISKMVLNKKIEKANKQTM